MSIGPADFLYLLCSIFFWCRFFLLFFLKRCTIFKYFLYICINKKTLRVMRTLYRTREDAQRAMKEAGKTGYLSEADHRSGLEIDYDSFGGNFCWSGEVQAYRTDDDDIFAWWE